MIMLCLIGVMRLQILLHWGKNWLPCFKEVTTNNLPKLFPDIQFSFYQAIDLWPLCHKIKNICHILLEN